MTTPRRRLILNGAAIAALALPTALWATSPSASAASATLAQDGFDRVVASGLGAAPTGGSWVIPTGSDTVSVANSQASFAGRAGSALNARLAGTSAADVDVTESLTIPSTGSSTNLMVGLNSRYSPTAVSGYRTWFVMSGSGSVSIHFDRLGRSGDTTLAGSGTVSSVVAAGRELHVRTRVTGANPVSLKATVWADGSTEPATQVSATDSSSDQVTNAGQVGLALVPGATTTPVTVQDFSATDLGAGATTPPTTTPPTTTPPATSPLRGSVPVGQASYPVPSGAVFVATNGNDANVGSQASPKRTVAAAVAKAPNGGTVVVRGGTYHEGGVEVYKPLSIQAYPGEAVWFDGSVPVTGWTQQGSVWKAPWSVKWDHSASYTTGVNDPDFIDPAYPLAAWPDQLFVDGRQLQQVSNTGTVGAGQFAVDYANNQIITGSNPAGHEMRGSDLKRLVTVGSPDVNLRGFGIRRYANAIPSQGLIFIARQRDLVENVVLEDFATTGISMTSDGKNGAGTINHVTVRRAGLTAMGGQMADNGRIMNSLIADGNTQHFTPFPATAGVKITRTKNITFDNNELTNNYNATALWTDEATIGVKAIRNRITNPNNDGFAGIQLELTSNGVIADNVVQGTRRGLYLYDSEHLRAVNNTIWDSQVADISVFQDFRREANASHNGHDPRNPIPDPNNTWISSDVHLRNNVFGTDSLFCHFQLYSLDLNQTYTSSQMIAEATGNVFETKDANSPTLIGWGRLDKQVTQYNDLSAWQNDVGRGWVNKTYPAGTSVQQAQSIASGMTHGVSLDSDIASLIGQTAGSKHIGAYQQI